MAQELSTEDAKALLALCASERLYAIEAWVQAGRSLEVPRALRKTPLDVAITTGFHSLIELLLRHSPSQQAKHAESRLAYLGHLLIENRHGLIADAMATTADGTAEREAGLLMLHAQWQRAPGRRRTVGADKAYDVRAARILL